MNRFCKLISLMLALVLMLCACGGDTPPSGTITGTPETTEPGVSDKPLTIGRIEGGTYTNEYMGFAIDLDSTWTYYSAEELQELPENVSDILSGTEFEEGVLTTITDMMAESVESMSSINVLYQKMDMTTRLAYAVMSQDEILDGVLTQSDSMIDAYAQVGMENVVIEKTTVTFLGETRPALKTTCSVQGLDCYLLQVFDYHLGQYSVTITFTCYLEDNTEEIAAMCYPIGE